jgi:hypothetical protein
MGGGYDGKGGFQYSPQIYKQLDLIKQAESFVAEQIAIELATAKTKAETEANAVAQVKSKPDPDAQAATPKKSTITCIKGKLTKKVTAVKPKCPTGYKKK